MNITTQTIVYIDGFNFYKYFTARVSPTPADPNVANRQDAYLRALEKMCPLVQIYFGHFLRHGVNLENVNPPPATCKVWKNEEKGSDVNLAVHIVNDAWKDSFQTAIVVSNDSDLAESLRIAKKERGKTIGLVTPGAPKRKTSRQLSRYADFITPIRSTALNNHQLPPQIPDTRITKPPSW